MRKVPDIHNDLRSKSRRQLLPEGKSGAAGGVQNGASPYPKAVRQGREATNRTTAVATLNRWSWSVRGTWRYSAGSSEQPVWPAPAHPAQIPPPILSGGVLIWQLP